MRIHITGPALLECSRLIEGLSVEDYFRLVFDYMWGHWGTKGEHIPFVFASRIDEYLAANQFIVYLYLIYPF